MSFADGQFKSVTTNLDLVNKRLQWNPHPPNMETRQYDAWNTTSLSPGPQLTRTQLLDAAKAQAEIHARRLALSDQGRAILRNEDPGPHYLEPQYWFARAACWETECQMIEKAEQSRLSRSVTPEVYHSDLFGDTELDQARGHAQNEAARLATLPGGKSLTEPETLGSGDCTSDPQVWRRRQKYYEDKIIILSRDIALERNKRAAITAARKLAKFTEGRAVCIVESSGESSTDPEYWRVKADQYASEETRLANDFWDCWKRQHLATKRTHRRRRMFTTRGLKTRPSPIVQLPAMRTCTRSTTLRTSTGKAKPTRRASCSSDINDVRTTTRRSVITKQQRISKQASQHFEPIASRLRSRLRHVEDQTL